MGKNYKILRNKPILSSKAIISNEMVKISKRKKSHFRLILKIILQNSSFKKKWEFKYQCQASILKLF